MGVTAVDMLVLLFVAVQAVWGIRRGFVLGLLEILTWVATLSLAIMFTAPLTALVRRVAFLPDGLTGLAVLFAIFGIGLPLIYGLLSVVHRRALAPRLVGEAARIDHVLGLLPGAVTGLVAAGVLLEAALFMPINPTWNAAIMESHFARPVALLAQTIADPIERLTLDAAQEAGSLVTSQHGDRPARFALPVTSLAQDTQAERRMLELLNEERSRRGLVPLVADERLSVVARQHSTEMLVKGYFAHESPENGDPFDRMGRAGIRYRVAGENLAFAPNVERAHQGLMNSPNHRENILRPEFRKVGIGAINGGIAGIMFTQDFAD